MYTYCWAVVAMTWIYLGAPYRMKRMRIRQRKAAKGCQSPPNQACECFATYECSSCSFQKEQVCGPQAPIQKVEKMGGNVGWAWKLIFKDKVSPLILKFDSDPAPIAAAQIAHLLAVPTPPILRVLVADCPVLYGAQNLNATLLQKLEQTRSRVTLQEFVVPTTNVYPGCELELDLHKFRPRPWVQVGIIAMFDWLVGKYDLFMNWGEEKDFTDGVEDTPQNRNNILITTELDKAVDIDLSFGVGRLDFFDSHREDLDMILRDLIAEPMHITKWIETNVLALFNSQSGNQGETFEFDKQGPRGEQVQLGMAYGLKDILDEAISVDQMLRRAGGPVAPLTAMLTATAGSVAALDTAIRTSENLLLHAKPVPSSYCRVQCQFQTTRKRRFVPCCSAQWEDCKKDDYEAKNDEKRYGSFRRAKPRQRTCASWFEELRSQYPHVLSRECRQACGSNATHVRASRVEEIPR